LFVTDVISEVVLGSFWLVLPGLGPNHGVHKVTLFLLPIAGHVRRVWFNEY